MKKKLLAKKCTWSRKNTTLAVELGKLTHMTVAVNEVRKINGIIVRGRRRVSRTVDYGISIILFSKIYIATREGSVLIPNINETAPFAK